MIAVLLLFAAVCAGPGPASSQETGKEENIFRRFAQERKVRKNWQALFELPVLLQPQSASDADIRKNLGLNYVSTFRPNSRWYFSRSIGFSRMEWAPKTPSIRVVKVRTFDITMVLNRLSGGWLVTSFGLGLGIMDGLVVFSGPDGFSERLEPFIPIQFGMAVRLGETIQLGLKISHFPFFRQKPAISTTRVLVGLGFNY